MTETYNRTEYEALGIISIEKWIAFAYVKKSVFTKKNKYVSSLRSERFHFIFLSFWNFDRSSKPYEYSYDLLTLYYSVGQILLKLGVANL